MPAAGWATFTAAPTPAATAPAGPLVSPAAAAPEPFFADSFAHDPSGTLQHLAPLQRSTAGAADADVSHWPSDALQQDWQSQRVPPSALRL